MDADLLPNAAGHREQERRDMRRRVAELDSKVTAIKGWLTLWRSELPDNAAGQLANLLSTGGST